MYNVLKFSYKNIQTDGMFGYIRLSLAIFGYMRLSSDTIMYGMENQRTNRSI